MTKTYFGILQGDALSVLKTMPDESVQCCVTSPPYYGLRNYQTEPQIWGGEAGCVHEWGAPTNATSGNFCSECGAWKGELGLEPTVQLYIAHLIQIFAEVKRVLKDNGTCWVNIGDTYNSGGNFRSQRDGQVEGLVSHEHYANTGFTKVSVAGQPVARKSLLNVPGRFAIAMTDELGFVQRNEVIWHKPSAMPFSGKDRFTVDFEPIYLFSKKPGGYKFNQIIEDAVTPAGTKGAKASKDRATANGVNSRPAKYHVYNGKRNKRATWSCAFEPQKEKHFASYPTKLIEPMILAGSDEGDVVLDPFNGTGTTGLVSLSHRRNYIGIELNPEYIAISERRLEKTK